MKLEFGKTYPMVSISCIDGKFFVTAGMRGRYRSTLFIENCEVSQSGGILVFKGDARQYIEDLIRWQIHTPKLGQKFLDLYPDLIDEESLKIDEVAEWNHWWEFLYKKPKLVKYRNFETPTLLKERQPVVLQLSESGGVVFHSSNLDPEAFTDPWTEFFALPSHVKRLEEETEYLRRKYG